MPAFIAQKLLRMVPVTLTVVTIIFFLFRAVPGDPAALLAGATATREEIQAIRVTLGLDRPLYVQYARHLAELARGQFGYSVTFKGDPLPYIVERLPATFALMGAGILMTIVLGLPAGMVAAVSHNRLPDVAISFAVVGLLAIPNFWLGLVLMAFFSVQLRWLPSFGFTGWLSLIMPTIALAARLIALVARTTRGVMLDELRKDYVRTAKSKGLGGRAVVLHHVLKNTLIPTVTVIGLQMGYLLGGSVVVERLFAWPGIGDLMINAIGARDYTLVEAITLLYVMGFLLVNLVVDVLYVFINPRIRYR